MRKYVFILIVLAVSLCSHAARAQKTRQINELQRLLSKNRADTGRISLLLETALWYVNKPGEDHDDLDKGINYANTALQLSLALRSPIWQGKSLIVLSDAYREKGDIENGRKNTLNAVELLKKCSCYKELGDAYVSLGMLTILTSEESYIARAGYYQQALHYYELSANKERQADVLRDLGDIHFMLGDKLLALSEVKRSLAIYQSIGYVKLQGIYDLIGTFSSFIGDYIQATRYGLLAIKTGEMLHDSSNQMSTIYNRYGVNLYNLNQFDSAVHYWEKAVAIAANNNDAHTVNVVSFNIVDACLRKDRSEYALHVLENIRSKYTLEQDHISLVLSFVKVYVSLKQFNKALPYVNELVETDKGLEKADRERINFIPALLGYYLATGQLNKLDYYSHEYVNCSELRGTPLAMSRAYLWRFRADSTLGNYKAAIADYENYIKLKDSIFNEKKSQQISSLQIQYETEKKEQNIQLLTKQAQLKQTQFDRVRLTKNIIIGGAVMLAILLGLGYNRYRLKQRSNTLLEAQQQEINLKNESLNRLVKEKEWLVKEMHHRVKNNLQVVMSLLNTQSMYLDNAAAQAAIQESQHRMHTISLIHQKLYQSDNSAMVSMPAYVRELIDYLRDSLAAGANIHFEQNIADIELDVAQAMPVGLILNEAVTNAIKYAFPDKGQGSVTVNMSRNSLHTISLIIADNGVGIPDYNNIRKKGSLGMSLMEGLASQLGSELILVNDNGLKIEIEFPETKEMIVNQE